MLCSVFDFGNCCFDICLLYCIVLISFVLFVCSVYPDKFHVRLSYDRIMDLRNDICMYVYFFKTLVTIYQTKRFHILGIYSLNYVSHSMSAGKFFPRGKWLGHEVDHSPPTRVKVKNKWKYTKLPCVCLHGLHRDNILFTFFAFYMKHYSKCLHCYVAFICGNRCWTIAYTTSDPEFQLPIEQKNGLLQVCSDVMVKTNPKSHVKSD